MGCALVQRCGVELPPRLVQRAMGEVAGSEHRVPCVNRGIFSRGLVGVPEGCREREHAYSCPAMSAPTLSECGCGWQGIRLGVGWADSGGYRQNG